MHVKESRSERESLEDMMNGRRKEMHERRLEQSPALTSHLRCTGQTIRARTQDNIFIAAARCRKGGGEDGVVDDGN